MSWLKYSGYIFHWQRDIRAPPTEDRTELRDRKELILLTYDYTWRQT